ncbi:MAG TPA: ABC transporter substrate-binding protein [Thermomicrobiales bacterium]|nr:ABC transporter substrate-binding protein [Thermomicrobiales bacterium]
MVRLIPEFRGAIDPESLDDINELIQARIDGGISRRQLVKRAAQIGIAAPVVGVMLHATSDMAYGKPSLGRDRAIVRMQTAGTKEVTGPTAPSGTPKEGGVLVASTIEEPDTLNPWITALVTGSDVLTGVFGGLMRYDSNQQIIPDLAESFEISTDGLIYTFKLRQGVTFHDGAAFTAKDVDATWKAIMNPDFTAYSQLGWDHIKTLDMPDDFTVVMNTTEAYAPFMAYISDPVSGAIISAAIFDKGPDYFRGDFGRAPIGTGPFKIDEWKAKEQIGLSRYDGYWGTKPKLDQIIYRINPDDNTQLVQLQTGEAQMAASSGSIGSSRLDEVLGYGTVDVYERPNMAWSHLDLKHVDFLRITKVRQALDYATPTQDIIDNIQKGRVVRAFADQAPITTVYATDITPRPYDLEKAKQLLTEAGLTQNGDGVWEGPTPTPSKDIDPNTDRGGPTKEFKMEFWYISGDSVTQQIAQVITQSWNSIGIKTEAKSEDVSTIWSPDGYQFNPDTMTACMYSWFNSNDPDNMYYWHSSQIPPDPTGAGGNAIAYFFPLNFQAKVDELTVAGAKETDPEKRKAIYIELQHLIFDETPVVFLWWSKDYSAVQPNIGGFWPSPFNRLLWNAQEWYVTE